MPRWLYFLLIMALVAPIVQLVGGTQQALAVFVCSAIALVPLAGLIGRAWAIVFARAGHAVRIYDSEAGVRAKVLDGKCWTTPIVSNGMIFARSTKEAVCLDVSGR